MHELQDFGVSLVTFVWIVDFVSILASFTGDGPMSKVFLRTMCANTWYASPKLSEIERSGMWPEQHRAAQQYLTNTYSKDVPIVADKLSNHLGAGSIALPPRFRIFMTTSLDWKSDKVQLKLRLT